MDIETTFDIPKSPSNIIKVIGVGGGGGNAVNHMFNQNIVGVDYVICNTDAQALQKSPIINKLQLGVSLTEGLGAGSDPEVGEQSAMESFEEIQAMLGENTKMVFITAGMGGGTGTGAAPIIAKICKDMGILTVGIVTSPFKFEGETRLAQAQKGIDNMRKYLDSLIVINNNKLREIYGNLGFKTGFAKADEVLTIAAKGIAEVITKHFDMNIDLHDARTVLKDSGTAIMGSGKGSGETRALDAIKSALDSPLLNDNKIVNAKNVLLLIVYGEEEITIDEVNEINEYVQRESGNGYKTNIIMGVGEDKNLGKDVEVTIIATGFSQEQQHEIINIDPQKVVYDLGVDQPLVKELDTKASFSSIALENKLKEKQEQAQETPKAKTEEVPVQAPPPEPKIIYTLNESDFEGNVTEPVPTSPVAQTPSPVISSSRETNNENSVFGIQNTELCRIPVEYEEVRQISNIATQKVIEEEDFIIYEPAKEIRTEEKEQELVLFEAEKEAYEVVAGAKNATKTPIVENERVVYTLSDSDYLEGENMLTQAKANENEANDGIFLTEKPIQKEQNVKFPEQILQTPYTEELKSSADKRKQTFKKFNHTFSDSAIIDDFDRVPAFIRRGNAGITFNATSNESNISRTSISMDSQNMPQLRDNNSFLHGNVD
ncbi:MAG: cell division protein FtsZ [Capnocytophaga sp.]|nr:cell division protein FtsZ [Capnocytophaga sp.]